MARHEADSTQTPAADDGRRGFLSVSTCLMAGGLAAGYGTFGVMLGRFIMGYEVSRLARNCADWHRLLELCALFDTLIGDSDGLYNPRDFNDRLLLGLK